MVGTGLLKVGSLVCIYAGVYYLKEQQQTRLKTHEFSWEQLENEGFTMMENVLSEEEIEVFKSSKTYKEKFSSVGVRRFRELNHRRYHRYSYGNQFGPALQEIEDTFRIYAEKYLAEFDTINCRTQLIFSSPKSVDQPWRRGNNVKGLSVYIPLVDVASQRIGSFEFVPKSHIDKFTFGSVRAYPLSVGDGLLFDARIFQRDRGNESVYQEKPGLLLEFYPDDHKPGSPKLLTKLSQRQLGHFFSTFSYLTENEYCI